MQRRGVCAGAIKTPLTRSILMVTPWQSPPISNTFPHKHTAYIIYYSSSISTRPSITPYCRSFIGLGMLDRITKFKFYITFGCSKRKAFIDVPDKQTRQLSVAIVLINDVKIRFIPVEKLKFDRLCMYLICL